MTLLSAPAPVNRAMRRPRLRAELHPAAWWLWALALAATANRTTNPLLLAVTLAAAGFVVVSCRRPDRRPGSGAIHGFSSFLRLGLFVLLIRTVFHILLGGVTGGPVLLRLPYVPLPAWLTGIRLGGPIFATGLIGAIEDAFRLATLLCCIGVAAVLASPRRLLDRLPGALYEVGVAVVVSLSLAPELVAGAGRVRRARELRGDAASGRGPLARARAWTRIALPVLADATDHALALAAALDGRGYGRNRFVPIRERRITGALLLVGLLGLCLGSYALLAQTSVAVRVIALAVGVAGAVAGLLLGSRRVIRTRLHSAPWSWREWAVVASGLAALTGSVLAEVLDQPLSPEILLAIPELPWAAFVGVMLAATPAWVARP